MVRLILCADDFGLSAAISETIVSLAADGRINAISCMAASPGWSRDSTLLNRAAGRAQIGLHLMLSDGRPVTRMTRFAPNGRFPHVDRLTARAIAGRLPLDEIVNEIDAQFALFIAAIGRAPDFVDGHQHVHSLPGIRRIAIAATALHAPAAWMRNCADRLPAMMQRPFAGKALASAVLSAGFARMAAASGIGCNQGFAGHYDFRRDYRDIFPAFLKSPGTDHLVMCHPGAGQAAADGIARARVAEADALRSMPVARLARAHGLDFACSDQAPAVRQTGAPSRFPASVRP